MFASFTSCIVQIIYVALVWILEPLHVSLFSNERKIIAYQNNTHRGIKNRLNVGNAGHAHSFILCLSVCCMKMKDCTAQHHSVMCCVARCETWFSGALAELRKATTSLVLSVCFCPHGTTRIVLEGLSGNLIFWEFFENLSRNVEFIWNLAIITRTLREDLNAFMMISCWTFLKTGDFSDKICRKIKTYFMFSYVQWFFFRKIIEHVANLRNQIHLSWLSCYTRLWTFSRCNPVWKL
jgi:hypothetical protein